MEGSVLADESGDRLDVMRVREEVEPANAREPVPGFSGQTDVPPERDGIAGHVDELRGPQAPEGPHDLLPRAGPGRIEHHGAARDARES